MNDLLQLLGQGVDLLYRKPEIDTSPHDRSAYEASMRALGTQIQALPICKGSTTNPPTLELFHLATLIYLNRASGNLLEAESQT